MWAMGSPGLHPTNNKAFQIPSVCERERGREGRREGKKEGEEKREREG